MTKPYRRFALINLVGLVLTGLLFTWISRNGTLDFAVANLFFDNATQQFPLRISHALDFWGHTVLKAITVWAWVLCIGLAIVSNWIAILKPWRRLLTVFVVMAGVAAFVVQTLKGASVHSCPWDIITFGGQALWFPLFETINHVTGPGRCWPGGHASGGFAIIAGYFALRESKHQLARWMLAIGMAFGIVMSLVQMARGAHFLSHNLWSLWLVWVTCFVIDVALHAVQREKNSAL